MNILGLSIHLISVATTQLCRCGVKSVTNNTSTNVYGRVPIKLYLNKTGIGPRFSPIVYMIISHSLTNPDLGPNSHMDPIFL